MTVAYMEDSLTFDPFTAILSMDDIFALLCRYTRKILHSRITLIALMVLVVGSCKTSPCTDANNVIPYAAQFQAALFPDRASFHGSSYRPAPNLLSRARDYIVSKPQAMTLLNRDEIGYLFGKPTFHRQDADAEVWQYKAGGCVIDLYFYGNNDVSYIDARHKDQTPASTSEVSGCLRNIAS